MVAESFFKTPEGEAKYRAAYNATLALWPVPHQALDVKTSFGLTHVNVAGSPELPTLLLLHGFGVCSTQWYANIEPLFPGLCARRTQSDGPQRGNAPTYNT